jgi:hypothetical protein
MMKIGMKILFFGFIQALVHGKMPFLGASDHCIFSPDMGQVGSRESAVERSLSLTLSPYPHHQFENE